LKILLAPMAITGQEALGSMGTDTPLSALSDKSKLLYTYFKQNFAQVTNPPIDPIREELVMSLVSFIGPRPNLFDLEGLSRRKRLEVRQPILTNEDLEKIRSISLYEDRFETKTLNMTYEASRGAAGMREALTMLCERAEAPCAAATTSSSCPTAWSARIASRCPRFWRRQRCTTISSARACAPPSVWWWKPAKRAKCTILPAWQAMAPKPSTPIWPSKRWPTCTPGSCSRTWSTNTKLSSATSNPSAKAC
jgi:hypothetical protein